MQREEDKEEGRGERRNIVQQKLALKKKFKNSKIKKINFKLNW